MQLGIGMHGARALANFPLSLFILNGHHFLHLSHTDTAPAAAFLFLLIGLRIYTALLSPLRTKTC